MKRQPGRKGPSAFFLLVNPRFVLYNAGMGYVFDYNDAVACQKWYQLEDNRQSADLQKQLF